MNFLFRQALTKIPTSLGSFRYKSYYVTTPIFYVNSNPHIGHLYTATLADTACRWQKFKTGADVKLVTGTDEHGLKVSQSAVRENLQESVFCDKVSERQVKHLPFILSNTFTSVC